MCRSHPTCQEEVELAPTSSVKTLQVITWDKVCIATSSDSNMNMLVALIDAGLINSNEQLPVHLQEYHKHRDKLSTSDGVILFNNRVVIPPSLQQDCLTALHAAHQSVSSMIARPESSIFWPGISHLQPQNQ